MAESKGTVIPVESVWFKVAVLVGSGVGAGVAFSDILYYSKLRKDDKMTAIKQSTATTMMWIHIALFVVFLLLFLWSVWALIFPKSRREAQTIAITSYTKQLLGSEATLMPAQPPIAAPATVTVKTSPA